MVAAQPGGICAMQQRTFVAACGLGLLMGGCGAEEATSPAPSNAPAMVSEMVGAEGSMVELGAEVALEIPAGAVEGATMITISRANDAAPDDALGAVYQFGSAG